MMRKILRSSAAMVASLMLGASASQAAYISIDDSDPNTVTIRAGQFEGGFLVDGVLLTSGYDSGSVTLLDGLHTISGSWITRGEGDGSRMAALFGLPGIAGSATSGIQASASISGRTNLTGSFGGYTGASYASLGTPGFAQDGSAQNGSLPFLSISFTSEAPQAVPEPASLALLGSGLLGFGLIRRRRQV